LFKEIIDFELLFFYSVRKAVVKNKVSFYSNVVAISSFGPLIIGVVNWAFNDIYRKAVQHLFESFI
jgi:hypothetical protein